MTHTDRSETRAGSGSANAAERLRPPPSGDSVEVVLDTDAYNEIDDQFALAYAYLSDRLDLTAVYAAPFHNQRSSGPADGMERSYDEILRMLELLGHRSPEALALQGASDYTSAGGGPVRSPASRDLVERAEGYGHEKPLYVVAIGAPTNVASAIERAPGIAERIVVVWLGGHPHTWGTAEEFNLRQDVHASRTLFDSGVSLVQIPCKNVAEHVRTTLPELDAHLSGRGEPAEYLLRIFADYDDARYDGAVWSKEIWDLAAVAYLVDPEWIPTRLVESPTLTDNLQYEFDPDRHRIRVATDARRDCVFRDFFKTLWEWEG